MEYQNSKINKEEIDNSFDIQNKLSYAYDKLCSSCNFYKRMSIGGCEYNLMYDRAKKDLQSFKFNDEIVNYIRKNYEKDFLIDNEKMTDFILDYQIITEYLKNKNLSIESIHDYDKFIIGMKFRNFTNNVLAYILIERCGFDYYNSIINSC